MEGCYFCGFRLGLCLFMCPVRRRETREDRAVEPVGDRIDATQKATSGTTQMVPFCTQRHALSLNDNIGVVEGRGLV